VSGISEVAQVAHHEVANAVGAAIAQVSGEVDQVFTGMSRSEAIERASETAWERAIRAGAAEEGLAVVEVEDLPLAYLPGDALRVRVRVVGDASPSH
jgi:N-methylhydantoinase A/oxoprolinase/acetone carboxylase beta subunit